MNEKNLFFSRLLILPCRILFRMVHIPPCIVDAPLMRTLNALFKLTRKPFNILCALFSSHLCYLSIWYLTLCRQFYFYSVFFPVFVFTLFFFAVCRFILTGWRFTYVFKGGVYCSVIFNSIFKYSHLRRSGIGRIKKYQSGG